jgi:heme exporter protein D
MFFWVGLAAMLLPLIVLLINHNTKKRAATKQLQKIQRRIAEKEQEAERVEWK